MYFVFTLSHMGPAFCVLGFGYVCSITVCVAECLHKRFSKWWQAQRHTYLHCSARRNWTVLTAPFLLLRVLCECVRAVRMHMCGQFICYLDVAALLLRKRSKLLAWLLHPTSRSIHYSLISLPLHYNSSVCVASTMGLTVRGRIPVDERITVLVQTSPAANLPFHNSIVFFSLRVNWHFLPVTTHFQL
jgi:hypothetical protein